MSGPSYDLSSAVPVAPAAADVLVHPDKLLDVARIVEEQANALEDQLLTRLGQLRIDAPSADVISTQSVQAWNTLIADGDRSYAGQVREYASASEFFASPRDPYSRSLVAVASRSVSGGTARPTPLN